MSAKELEQNAELARDEAISRIEARLDELARDFAYTKEIVETLAEQAGTVLEDVRPMLESLASNPLFKLIGGRKS